MSRDMFKFLFAAVLWVFTGIFFSGSTFAAGTQIINEGIRFPDGTLQTTKGVGSIAVYDGNNVFLGYLIDTTGSTGGGTIFVYNPEISGGYSVCPLDGATGKPFLIVSEIGSTFYASEDCSGQKHVGYNGFAYPWYLLMRDVTGNVFYIFDKSLPLIGVIQIKSMRGLDGVCRSFTGDVPKWFIPMKQISFPLAEIELAYPITVRSVE